MTLEKIEVGQRVSERVGLDQEKLDRFVAFSGDAAAAHTDDAFARKLGFPRRIVHGFLVSSVFSRLLGMRLPGERSVIQQLRINFRKPVFPGDEIEAAVEVTKVVPSVRVVVLALTAERDGETILDGTAQCIFPS